MKSSDQIIVRGLEVRCHVGVPDEERAESQELLINLTLHPIESSAPLNDDIERTVNYYEVSLRIVEVAQAKPRKLIETLAEDLTSMILAEFDVSAVSLEIEKFILPNARHVGVLIHRDLSDV